MTGYAWAASGVWGLLFITAAALIIIALPDLRRKVRDLMDWREFFRAGRDWLYIVAVTAFIAALLLLLNAVGAFAHDSWISRGAFKNSAGEWCCGDYDCKSYQRATSTAKGWMIDGELVPYDEAMPLVPPDGQLTICRRPDGSRRCVFGLKPGL